MTVKTKSEGLFESLCAEKEFQCTKIPETEVKTADYQILVGGLKIIVEVKQLEKSKRDIKYEANWENPNGLPALAPSLRVQNLLSSGYKQIKNTVVEGQASLIVLYNNSAEWCFIDEWTVSRAMFGDYGFTFAEDDENKIAITGSRRFGRRKVTAKSFRMLSAVAVLLEQEDSGPYLVSYHNPFAKFPIKSHELKLLSRFQYKFPNPYEDGAVDWQPVLISG